MFRKFLLCMIFSVLSCSALFAEIVVLDGGKSMKVKSYSVVGDQIHLAISDRAEMTIPVDWVREIRPSPPEPAPAIAEIPASPEFAPEFAYSRLVLPLAQKHDMDWKLVAAVVAVESNFNAYARSPKGAQGLMQLMPATARMYSVTDPYDPSQNVDAGIQHLKMLINRYGKLDLALAAYNAGEKTVDHYRGIPPFAETRTYVKKVLQLFRELSS